MRRVLPVPILMTLVGAVAGTAHAQSSGGYTLVPNWPTLPPGLYFGLKEAPPPPAEREAQAAARRARGGHRPVAEEPLKRRSRVSRESPSTPAIASTSSTAGPSR